MPQEDQEKIKKQIGDDFPYEQFKIYIINFFGNKDEKFVDIKEKIGEFLQETLGESSYSKNLLIKWFEMFMVNCADKPDKTKSLELTKKEILMPLVVLVVENPVKESEFEKVSDYDNFDELISTYRSVINSKVYDYEFCGEVTGDFSIKRENALDKKNFKYQFVEKEWEKYEQYFLDIKDDEEREALVKLILLTLIGQRRKFQKIKEAANI